ncbi:MAG: hypothetical protein U0M13_07810, partial [Desulfovibrio fairfieldensis]|nr:hypothetical protein [Desulfovibrio fairfieldensis]
RHQPSACASLRRSKGGFASFCSFPDLSGNKDFLDASALAVRIAAVGTRSAPYGHREQGEHLKSVENVNSQP